MPIKSSISLPLAHASGRGRGDDFVQDSARYRDGSRSLLDVGRGLRRRLAGHRRLSSGLAGGEAARDFAVSKTSTTRSKVTFAQGGPNSCSTSRSATPHHQGGVTVATEIELEDKFENRGARWCAEVAFRPSCCGDGTTTATVLARRS